MDQPPIQYARTSENVNIAYLSVGAGPPIVFASNIFGDAHLYRAVWPHVRGVTDQLVARGWRVIRYDHRGMGSSDREVGDLSLAARIKDLEAIVERIGLQRFALAGVDLGAATAIAYAVAHPALVSHLVLLSPWTSGAQLFAIPDLRLATASGPTGAREWDVFTNVLGSISTAFEDQQLGRQIAEAIQRTTSPQGLAAYYAASRVIDLTVLLPCVATPTLVVHEPAFPFGSFALCQKVAAAIRDARFVVVEDRSIAGTVHDGHVAAIDQFLRDGAMSGSVPMASISRPPSPSVALPDRLTPREAEVLSQVAAGLTNKEIAAQLAVAVPTVERHLVNLYAKIGARGRADAVAYALRHSLDIRTP